MVLRLLQKDTFPKLPKDLSIAESAVLVGSLKAPSKISLIANKEASIARAKMVLNLLEKNKLISSNEKNNAQRELNKIKKYNFIQIIK